MKLSQIQTICPGYIGEILCYFIQLITTLKSGQRMLRPWKFRMAKGGEGLKCQKEFLRIILVMLAYYYSKSELCHRSKQNGGIICSVHVQAL